MVSDDTTDAKFSRFSLAVAKDSGWYEIDLEKGEHFFWGKGEGCDILGTTCPHTTVDEFCDDNAGNSCSDNHLYKSACQKYEFTGNCSINLHQDFCKTVKTSGNNYFKYSKDSMCLKTHVR